LITYLDTSALLKQYIQEAGSEDVEKFLRSSDITGIIINMPRKPATLKPLAISLS
jgi:PIN domain nuclease of toxin-antitoxin system